MAHLLQLKSLKLDIYFKSYLNVKITSYAEGKRIANYFFVFFFVQSAVAVMHATHHILIQWT